MSNKNRELYNAYMRDYMLQRYRRRRKEAIEVLGGVCKGCGCKTRLEFHHSDPAEKDFTVAKGSSFSDERWQAEIQKCILLCYDCHKEEHNGSVA